MTSDERTRLNGELKVALVFIMLGILAEEDPDAVRAFIAVYMEPSFPGSIGGWGMTQRDWAKMLHVPYSTLRNRANRILPRIINTLEALTTV